MKKTISVLLICLTLGGSLAACGNGSSPVSVSQSAVSSSSSSTPAAAEEYTLQEVSFQVPAALPLMQQGPNEMIFSNGSVQFSITNSQTGSPITQDEFVEEMVSFYRQRVENEKDVEDAVEIDLSGTPWYMVRVSNPDGTIADIYLYSTGYMQYSLQCLSNDGANNTYLQEILATVLVEANEDEAATPTEGFDMNEAAHYITGEWLASGEGGVFVFLDDGTVYSYKDESKSKDNVLVGTWEIREERVDLDGNIVGFAMDVLFTSFTLDGETQEIDNARLFEIHPKGDDICRLENITNSTGNDLTRIA